MIFSDDAKAELCYKKVTCKFVLNTDAKSKKSNFNVPYLGKCYSSNQVARQHLASLLSPHNSTSQPYHSDLQNPSYLSTSLPSYPHPSDYSDALPTSPTQIHWPPSHQFSPCAQWPSMKWKSDHIFLSLWFRFSLIIKSSVT